MHRLEEKLILTNTLNDLVVQCVKIERKRKREKEGE